MELSESPGTFTSFASPKFVSPTEKMKISYKDLLLFIVCLHISLKTNLHPTHPRCAYVSHVQDSIQVTTLTLAPIENWIILRLYYLGRVKTAFGHVKMSRNVLFVVTIVNQAPFSLSANIPITLLQSV
jgi:hypothetical protein